MNRTMTRLAAAALAAAMAAAPAMALAQETAPLAARAQQEETAPRERLPHFGSVRSYLGVEASHAWMRQAKVGGVLLEMRLFTPEGEQLTFQEKLGPASGGGKDIRLMLRAASAQEGLLLQMDEQALLTLIRLGVTEIAVADTDLYVQAEYLTADLAAMRSLFALGAKEYLCVSGEEEPVTVVSEDGVRRQITQ